MRIRAPFHKYAWVFIYWKYNEEPLDITWQEFLNYVDNNGSFNLLTEFGQWYSEILMANLDFEKNKKKADKKAEKKSSTKLEKNV